MHPGPKVLIGIVFSEDYFCPVYHNMIMAPSGHQGLSTPGTMKFSQIGPMGMRISTSTGRGTPMNLCCSPMKIKLPKNYYVCKAMHASPLTLTRHDFIPP